ncbi:MAG: serine/threonine-protein kinase [Bryobacteraceae bacterium]
MTAEVWNRIEQVFSQALELEPSSRATFLQAQDPTLRQHVESLLAAHDQAGDYLESGAVDFLRENFSQYRASKEIGRGGMSVVYLGERLGGEFERTVAIKVLLGASGPMAEETRILAGLEHSHIARLYDAGITSAGFRYLVMEYIDGAPIDLYSRELTEAQKLRLFLQVCAGVQYAHRSLIVHRDIKPANILVTTDGVAKLLDFGIAKMLSLETAGHTTGVRAWTPDYASPEQIQGRPITTSTDVYSLGVVLHELLTGKTPRSFENDSLERILERAANEEVAVSQLTGDLALIAGKALRRDPAERYESVAALAADIERYLDGRPISARPLSRSYLISKFIRRHRWAVAAATTAIVALIVTATIAILQARLARERFDQVRGLSRTMLFELHDAIAAVPGTIPARQLLARRGLEYLDRLAERSATDTALEVEIAQGYLRLGAIEGGMGGPNLGNTGAALERNERARTILENTLRRDPSNTAAKAHLVDALASNASALIARNRAADAIPLARRAVQLAESSPQQDQEQYAKALRSLGLALQNQKGAKDESIPVWEKLIALYTDIYKRQPGNTTHQRNLAMAHRVMAYSKSLQNDWAATEKHTLEAHTLNLSRLKAGDPTAKPDVAYDLGSLASIVRRKGARHAEAAAYLEQQLALRREMAAAEPANAQMKGGITFALSSLTLDYLKLGRTKEAIAAGEEAVRIQREVQAHDPGYVHGARYLFEALAGLGRVYAETGAQAKACTLAREAQTLLDGPLKQAPVDSDPAKWVRQTAPACF